MLDSSQKLIDFLVPLAAVVYIIVAVLVFLLRNRERLEREIASEAEPPQLKLHDPAIAHTDDASGAGTDLGRVSNKNEGLPPARV